MPAQMGPLPESFSEKVGEPGDIPTMADLGLKYREQVRWCEMKFFLVDYISTYLGHFIEHRTLC